jgi:thiol-disulfide isomerase/thioredoxin
MTLLLLLALAAPPDALPDSLPDALPDAQSSGTPEMATDIHATKSVPLPDRTSSGATAAQPSAPPAPAASVVCYVWGAKWCTWCRVMHPAVQQLREEGWPIYEYDVDAHANLAAAWEAYTLPTVIVLRIEDGEGVALERAQAYQTYEQLRAMLQRNGVKQDTGAVPSSTTQPAQGCAGGSCGTWRWRGR